jgi:hypothetical protein
MEAGMNWKDVHESLVKLAVERGALDYEEACLLAAARRLAVHVFFGYGSLLEYVMRTLGLGSKVARERLRVAEALEDLPTMTAALRDGTASWSTVRELTRVAVRDTEAEWLAAVKDRTVRQVENMISGFLPGDRPSDEPKDEARREVLRFEISGATAALWREAQAQLIRETGGSLADDDLLQLMARRVLGASQSAEEGRATYQIAVTLCERCKRGWQDGGGRTVAMTDSAVAQAECDAQRIADTQKATQDVTPAVRRQVQRRDHGRCVVDGCTQAIFLDVHHIQWREDAAGTRRTT